MKQVWIGAIRRLMVSRDWTQGDLSEKSGVRPNTLSDLLSGKDTRASTLQKIADGFGVPMWALFVGEQEYGAVNAQLAQAASESDDARQKRHVRSILESQLPNILDVLTSTISERIADGTLKAHEPPKPQAVPQPERTKRPSKVARGK